MKKLLAVDVRRLARHPRRIGVKTDDVQRRPSALRCYWAALTCLVLVACTASDPVAVTDPALIRCPTARPEVCAQVYEPVCATGAAASAADRKTYSNACAACSDPAVHGYIEASCR